MMSSKASLCDERIEELHLSEPVTVPPDMSLGNVIEVMQRRRRGAVLVSRGTALKGIFTERDVINSILGSSASLSDPVEKFLSGQLLFVRPSDEVGRAIDIMAEHGLRHLAVCGKDLEPLGVVSVRNIIACLAERYPAEIVNQPPRAGQTLPAPEGG